MGNRTITDEAVEAAAVTRDEAIAFLESACRNWSRVPKLSDDDIDDVAAELTRFASKRVLSSPTPEAAKEVDWGKDVGNEVLPTPDAEELEVVAWRVVWPHDERVDFTDEKDLFTFNPQVPPRFIPLTDHSDALALIEKLRAERDEALQEHTDMMWQRRRADERTEDAEAERDALQRFKDYVHQRLDVVGIPTHPDGEHSKAGCRIGDRLDLLIGRAEAAEARLAEVVEVLRPFADEAEHISDRSGVPEANISDDIWVSLRLRHCRRARAFLASHGKEG